MDGHLIAADGSAVEASPESVRRLLTEGELLWLDLHQPSDEQLSLLGEGLGIHPLTIEDMKEFGQRPKLEEYDDFTQIVAYGVQGMGEPMIEIHCVYSERYLVTVHRDACAPFDRLRTRLKRPTGKRPSRAMVLYHVLDGLVDGFFPALSGFDDRIDELQDAILSKPTDEQLGELFTMKRWLISVRKIITPQRDMLASLASGVTELPGMTPGIERYYRDLYDHLIRISDLVDSYRDLLTGSMDSYLSTVSNRLNEVMKQLTIIATIFLPLSFLTGFFGQNFAWLVNRLQSLPAFIVLGIGTEVAAVAGLLWLFRRRGWL